MYKSISFPHRPPPFQHTWSIGSQASVSPQKTRTNVSKSRVLKAITTTTSDISSRALMEPIARAVMEAPVHDEKIVYLRNYNTLNGIIFK